MQKFVQNILILGEARRCFLGFRLCLVKIHNLKYLAYVITVASRRLTRSLRIFLFKILAFCSDFSSYLCKERKETTERLVLKREGPPCERNSREPLARTWNRGRGITEGKYSDTYTFDVRLQITWTRLVQRPFVRYFRARVHRGRKVYFTSAAIFVFHCYSLCSYVLLL